MSDEHQSFNPNSTDAMFARILARLEEQDRTKVTTDAQFLAVLNEIRAEAKITNGRVTGLEDWRTATKAKLAVVSASVSAVVAAFVWIADKLFA